MNPLDAFNVDLSHVNTDRPVLRAGKYRCTINKYTVTRNDEKRNTVLTLFYALASEGVDLNNNPVNPGFLLSDRINRFDRSVVEQDEKKARANEIGEQTLARIVVAAGLSKGIFNPESLIGREIVVGVDVEVSQEYGPQNRIKGYFKTA